VDPVPFITAHAIARYRDRVDHAATSRDALRAIREILRRGRTRSRPRHWTRVDARPGCRYVYSADHPGICLVLRGGAVVTVFSRATCASWPPPGAGATMGATSKPYHRPAPNRWDWEAA
jgi:hypothetical protein